MFVFALLFVPETKVSSSLTGTAKFGTMGANADCVHQGMSLEKMDDLFGVTELVKQLVEDEERAQSIDEKADLDGKNHHVEVTEGK